MQHHREHREGGTEAEDQVVRVGEAAGVACRAGIAGADVVPLRGHGERDGAEAELRDQDVDEEDDPHRRVVPDAGEVGGGDLEAEHLRPRARPR